VNTDDLGMVVRTDPIMALNTCAALSDSCGAGGFTVAYGLSELGTQSLDAAAEGVGELVHADDVCIEVQWCWSFGPQTSVGCAGA